MSDNTVVFEESPRTYYTRIPNLIDDSDLTPHAYRLYGHLRRVAGDTGACWKSTATLAKACHMSAGMVSKCKQELVTAGLIRIEEKHNEQGQYHHITIVDVWHKNAAAYGADSPDELPSSYSELPMEPSSQGEHPTPRGSSQSETKKNHAEKKNPNADPMESDNGRAWFMALADLCVVDLAVSTKTQRDQLGQTAKILRTKAEASPEQITAFGEWWYGNDWRGKQGQPPTPAQVRSEWGKFKASGVADGRRVIRIGR